ncbi:MAG: hypothetical protein AAGF81_11155 [Pseudomonadota bacterium]
MPQTLFGWLGRQIEVMGGGPAQHPVARAQSVLLSRFASSHGQAVCQGVFAPFDPDPGKNNHLRRSKAAFLAAFTFWLRPELYDIGILFGLHLSAPQSPFCNDRAHYRANRVKKGLKLAAPKV